MGGGFLLFFFNYPFCSFRKVFHQKLCRVVVSSIGYVTTTKVSEDSLVHPLTSVRSTLTSFIQPSLKVPH